MLICVTMIIYSFFSLIFLLICVLCIFFPLLLRCPFSLWIVPFIIKNIHQGREFQKNIYFCFIDYPKAFDCVDHNKLWKILKERGIPHLPASWETCMQVKKQQLDLDMEQWTGSKLGKEYVKAVYCHPASLTYMQSTSWETLDWKKHKLESRLPGEIST